MLTVAKRSLEGIRQASAELWRDGRGWILLSISAGWFLSIGVRLVYPALAPFFRDDLGIGLGTTGLLFMLLWVAYAVGHIPGGILGDRVGEGRILVISTVLAGLTVLGVALSVNVWMLFIATITFGFATALFGPTRFTVFTDIYDERAGSAIGITMAAGSAGNAILPIVSTIIAAAIAWRYSFGALVAPFFVVAVALWLSVPPRTSETVSAVEELSWQTLKRIKTGISSGTIPTVVAIQVSFSFMFQGFSGFYPLYLNEVKGFSPELASTLFGLFFAASFIVQPIAGSSRDRYGTRLSLIGILGVSVTALWILPFVSGLVSIVFITIVLSVLNGCAVVTQTHIAESLPDDMKGTGLGTLKAGWMTLGATSAAIIGILGDFGHLDGGFLVLAAVGTVGLLLTVFKL